MSHLFDNYRLRERYVRRALKRAKYFSWDKIATKTILLYKEVTGRENFEIKKSHIKERDLYILKEVVKVKFNFEITDTKH